MPLKEELVLAQKEAMKAGDSKKLSILRMVLSAMKNDEIDKRRELEDGEVREVVKRQVKQLQDALVDFTSGQRNDLVEQAKFEIDILSAYLPKQLSEMEIKERVNTILSALGAKENLNAGQAIGVIMKELKEVADGNVVKKIVLDYLK